MEKISIKNKNILVPFAVFIFTILSGLVVFYAAFRVQKKEPVAPVAPEKSKASNGCFLDISIQDTVPRYKIGDFVWHDVNHNGIQDDGEPGIPGVSVKLFTSSSDCSGEATSETTSGSNGGYSFNGLESKVYFVNVVHPEGYAPTLQDIDGNQRDSEDSDTLVNAKTCHQVELTNSDNLTVDFGFYRESHLECSSQACVTVDGPGENVCSADTDCYRTACVDNACVQVDQSGPNECSADSECVPPATHLACVNQACQQINGEGIDGCSLTNNNADCFHLSCVDDACVAVDGEGANTCDVTADCTPEPETHLSCVNQACVAVNGAGSNDCGANTDCYHFACKNDACEKVDGDGENTCNVDGDCEIPPETHLECANQACVLVNGEGSNECASNTDCYHFTCKNDACEKVDGDGANVCNDDGDCKTEEPTHLSCVDQTCIAVSGEGSNECGSNTDCYHFACKNDACEKVDGDGTNTCESNSDCKSEKVADTHSICRNQACILVSGTGSDECSKNTDCAVRTVQEEAPRAKAELTPVPDTGVNDIKTYVAIGVGMIIAGLALIGKNIL